MNYADLSPQAPIAADTLNPALLLMRRALVLGSAVLVAFLISGGVFTFTPLLGLRIAHTSGISMEPGFKDGDVVLIRDAGEGDFEVGDIVVFEDQGLGIMHRVIQQHTGPDGGTVVVTQGDNVPWPDRPIAASQVSGKVVARIPLLGALSRLIHAEGGFYVYRSLVLTLAVSAVAVWAIVATARRRSTTPAIADAATATADTSQDSGSGQ